MAQINPLLEKLQQKIENYNKEVEAKIESVSTRQGFITIGAILINLLVLFLSGYFLPDDTADKKLRLIAQLSNSQLSILITIMSRKTARIIFA